MLLRCASLRRFHLCFRLREAVVCAAVAHPHANQVGIGDAQRPHRVRQRLLVGQLGIDVVLAEAFRLSQILERTPNRAQISQGRKGVLLHAVQSSGPRSTTSAALRCRSSDSEYFSGDPQ